MLISSAHAQTTSEIAVDGEAPYELSQEKMFMDTMIFLGLLFVIFYFVLIRPQQKKFKSHQAMTSALKRGDEIITSGGLIGKISSLKGDHIVMVELADGVQIKVARSSISDIYKEPAPLPVKTEAAKPAPKAANDK